MFDKESLKKAWRRDGSKDEARSEEVEELLTPNERVGFEEGQPLLDRPYSEYPRNDELLRPAARDALSELISHDLVTSTEDVVAELGSREEKVERALSLHDLTIPTETFDVEVSTDRLDGLVDFPNRMVSADNPILVATLYVEMGVSVSEIREVIDEATHDNTTVSERDVRQALVDAKVIDGETSAEAERRRQQSRGEGHMPDTRGLSISTEDV